MKQMLKYFGSLQAQPILCLLFLSKSRKIKMIYLHHGKAEIIYKPMFGFVLVLLDCFGKVITP